MKEETFQDPSELMKRALFRSLLIVAVAVVLYMFCVAPEQTALKMAKEKKTALGKQLAEWKGIVARKAEVKAENRDISSTVTNKMEKLLLERDQILGDYESTAKTLLDPIAKLLSFPDQKDTNEWKNLEIRLSDKKREPRRLPLPATAVPLPPNSSLQLYARQPICLTCTGPRESIITFIAAVEDIAAGGEITKKWLKDSFEQEKREDFGQLTEKEREERANKMEADLKQIAGLSEKLSGITLEAFTFTVPQGKDDKWWSAEMVFEWPIKIKLEKKEVVPQGGKKK